METPENASMAPAKTNSRSLCSDIQTSCGTALTRLAMTAPAPIETSSAGSAQHKSVPSELNRVTVWSALFFKFTTLNAGR